MYLAIYIVIGIVAALLIFLMIIKKKGPRDNRIIGNDKGKKTQFNPEKVSGMMPSKTKREVEEDN